MPSHLGKLGQSISIPITITGYINRSVWKTDTRIYVCVDAEDNTITFTSDAIFPIGIKLLLEGRVKRHKQFNGQPQTHISKWSFQCI